MEFSPRYVEHHAKERAKELLEAQCGACSTEPESSQRDDTPVTPEQPTLPMAPRPPSYGPVGQSSSKAIRRTSYGPLGVGSQRALNWESNSNLAKQAQGGISGSGDWGDIQHSLSGILEEDTSGLMVDEELGIGEESSSWEGESAMNSFRFDAAANYDSSYDSQSSMCGSEAEAFAQALEQAFVLPACAIPAPPKVHPMQAEPRDTGQQFPGGHGSPPSHHPMPLEPHQAGLEFASGVHLIDEMEDQVKQWEETENSREVAYNAWVQQQMMRAVNLGTVPSAMAQ